MRTAAAMTAALMMSAGCGSAAEPSATPTSPSPSAVRPTAAPSSPPAVPLAPLTGLPATPGHATRPAMAVIVGVSPGAAGPAGLSDADVVYAEYAEGGLLRLLALFQSRDAAMVGPVTSIRPTDPRVLEVFHGCVGYTSGSSGFVQQLTASGVCGIRSAQFTDTSQLYAQVPKGRTVPPPTFVYATPGQPLGSLAVTPAKSLTVTPPGRASQSWMYDAKTRLWRSVVGGVGVSAVSVEVLTMVYRAIVVHSPLRTLSGATVFGQGAATVVSGGQAVHGSWYRPSAKTLANVVDEAKQVVHPAPGRSWVLYAPTGSSVVVR